jgi:hypothetical protein
MSGFTNEQGGTFEKGGPVDPEGERSAFALRIGERNN